MIEGLIVAGSLYLTWKISWAISATNERHRCELERVDLYRQGRRDALCELIGEIDTAPTTPLTEADVEEMLAGDPNEELRELEAES